MNNDFNKKIIDKLLNELEEKSNNQINIKFEKLEELREFKEEKKKQTQFNFENIGKFLGFIISKSINLVFFIIQKIFYYTNLLLDKTGKKKQILTGLFLAITVFSLKTIYKTEIDFFFYDMRIREAEAQQMEINNNKNKSKDEYHKTIEETMFKMINDFSDLKQQQCIQDNIVDFMKQKREEGIIVSEDVVELMKIDLMRDECNREILNEEVYKHLVEVPYSNLLLKHKEQVKEEYKQEEIQNEIKAKELEEKIYKEEKKVVSHINYNEELAKNVKFNGDLKAVFCVWGHGLSKNGKYDDNGAYGIHTNEREAIMKTMTKTCDMLENYYKDKNVAVYRIGEQRMKLVDKIKKVNEISKANGYDEKNSLLVSLHWNKVVGKPSLNGVEVFYSGYEQNDGFQANDFAQRMLFELKQKKDWSNHYAVKPDNSARHWRIGILSDTKPLSILVEYGFLSNEKDDLEAKENPSYISETIFNGIVKFGWK